MLMPKSKFCSSIALFIISLSFSFSLNAQNSPFLYIQTNHDYYDNGEVVWFKLYVLDNDNTLIKSEFLVNVHVLDSHSGIVDRRMVKLKEGIATGHLVLSDKMDNQNLKIVASVMGEIDIAFAASRNIVVGKPKSGINYELSKVEEETNGLLQLKKVVDTDELITLEVSKNYPSSASLEYSIKGMQRGEQVFFAEAKVEKSKQLINIEKDKIKEGLIELFLIEKSTNHIQQITTYVKPKDLFDVKVDVLDKNILSVSLDIPDSLNVSYAISIVDDNGWEPSASIDMNYNLIGLQADLVPLALNALIGAKEETFVNTLKLNKTKNNLTTESIKIIHDPRISLNGSIMRINQKRVRDANIIGVLYGEEPIMAATQSDKEGNFNLYFDDFYDYKIAVLQMRNRKGNKTAYDLLIDTIETPDIPSLNFIQEFKKEENSQHDNRLEFDNNGIAIDTSDIAFEASIQGVEIISNRGDLIPPQGLILSKPGYYVLIPGKEQRQQTANLFLNKLPGWDVRTIATVEDGVVNKLCSGNGHRRVCVDLPLELDNTKLSLIEYIVVGGSGGDPEFVTVKLKEDIGLETIYLNGLIAPKSYKYEQGSYTYFWEPNVDVLNKTIDAGFQLNQGSYKLLIEGVVDGLGPFSYKKDLNLSEQ